MENEPRENVWYEFEAPNSRVSHGYGSREQAEKYLAILNRDLVSSLFSMRDAQRATIRPGERWFRLEDALPAPQAEVAMSSLSPADLEHWRLKLEMSLDQAAQALGISANLYRAYEFGERQIPLYIAHACQWLVSQAKP